MQPEIEQIIKSYLQAYHRQDFDTLYNLLYHDDMEEFQQTIVEFADKMEIFGETEAFLQRLGIASIQALKALSLKEFITKIFQMITVEIGEGDIKKMVKSTEITNIDQTEYLTRVNYQMSGKLYDSWEVIESHVDLLKSQGEWKILFKSGMREGLKPFEHEYDLYHGRKSRDRVDALTSPENLEIYTVIGYKNEKGEVVFEARFKDAGEFSEGLAYVQLVRKYGYIDLTGEIVILPKFDKARDFHEGMAAVKINTGFFTGLWGFIDKKGEQLIATQYEEVSHFSEGLCAVFKENKWGYINAQNEVVIPFRFDEADVFEDGRAEVSIYSDEGEESEFWIDPQGNILEG